MARRPKEQAEDQVITLRPPEPCGAWMAENMEYLRELNGFTWGSVAGFSGVEERRLYALKAEREGANPTLDTITKIAGALRVRASDLLDRPDDVRRRYPSREHLLPLASHALFSALSGPEPSETVSGDEQRDMRTPASGRMRAKRTLLRTLPELRECEAA